MTVIVTEPQEDRIPFEDVLPRVENSGASPRGSTYWKRVQSCPREHLLGTLLRWEPNPRAHALDFGLLWHWCLEAYYRTMHLNQLRVATPITPERAAFEALQPFCRPSGWAEIYEKVGRMLDSYFTRWQGADNYWQIVGVETTVGQRDNFGGPPVFYDIDGFPYTSKLDLAIIDHSGVTPIGRHVEHKSAWRLEPNLLTGYGQDDQVLGQIYLGERVIDWARLGVRYGGALVNITTKTKDPSNERIPVYPSIEQIASWAKHKRYWHGFVENLERHARVAERDFETWNHDDSDIDNVFPKNYTQCVRRFGRCAYFNYCRERPEENLAQIRRRDTEGDLPERFRKLDVIPETTE